MGLDQIATGHNHTQRKESLNRFFVQLQRKRFFFLAQTKEKTPIFSIFRSVQLRQDMAMH